MLASESRLFTPLGRVSPAAFDRALAAEGYSMRSFNLGIGAAKVPEVCFLLERLEREPPAAALRDQIPLIPNE